MLRTLPTKRLAKLEEQLPEALRNTTLVNGLECKLNNQTSKVSTPPHSTLLQVTKVFNKAMAPTCLCTYLHVSLCWGHELFPKAPDQSLLLLCNVIVMYSHVALAGLVRH